MTRTYTRGAVCIDGPEVFPALIADDRWNGFAVPYFTRAVAEQVAAWFVAAMPGEVSASWDGDTLTLDDTGVTGYPDPDRYAPVVIGGVQYWPIGAYAWTWFQTGDYVTVDPGHGGWSVLIGRGGGEWHGATVLAAWDAMTSDRIGEDPSSRRAAA